MKNRLIGFTGAAGAGKSTAAALLEATHCRFSFASPIRSMLREIGLTSEHMSTGKMAPVSWLGGKTPREMLQTLGTEWGRQMVDSEIWVNVARQRIIDNIDDGHGIVFDDVRFDNEALMIRAEGGLIVQVLGADTVPMEHISERGVRADLVDLQIRNFRDQSFRTAVLALVTA